MRLNWALFCNYDLNIVYFGLTLFSSYWIIPEEILYIGRIILYKGDAGNNPFVH